jgi:hypothetical protein
MPPAKPPAPRFESLDQLIARFNEVRTVGRTRAPSARAGHPTAPADKACYGDQVLEAKEFSSAAGVVDALFTIAIACDNDDGESSEARVSVRASRLCPAFCLRSSPFTGPA